MILLQRRQAANRKIERVRSRYQLLNPRSFSLTPPEMRARKKPGSTGKGEYFHIEVRPKEGFVTFRTQDVGRRGHVQRVAGKRANGSWATIKWLIGKNDAHVRNGRLIPDSTGARKILQQLGSKPKHVQGDRFEAKPRPNVPEHAKPTPAQRRAQRKNIKKAQAARYKRNRAGAYA
jgi:hypothetical protein